VASEAAENVAAATARATRAEQAQRRAEAEKEEADAAAEEATLKSEELAESLAGLEAELGTVRERGVFQSSPRIARLPQPTGSRLRPKPMNWPQICAAASHR